MPRLFSLSHKPLIPLGLFLGSLAVGYIALAWTSPTATPPGNNVAAPINVSGNTQGKTGSLGIGTASPNTRLQVGDGGDGWANGITLYSSYPTIYFRNSQGYRSAMLHVNGDQFYVLSGCGGNDPGSGNTWCTGSNSNGMWPLQIDLPTGNLSMGGNVGIKKGATGFGLAVGGNGTDTSSLWVDGASIFAGNPSVNQWDSQYYSTDTSGSNTPRHDIGGAHGWDQNMLYINGWGDWTSGVSVGGPGGASNLTVTGSLCLSGSCISNWSQAGGGGTIAQKIVSNQTAADCTSYANVTVSCPSGYVVASCYANEASVSYALPPEVHETFCRTNCGGGSPTDLIAATAICIKGQ